MEISKMTKEKQLDLGIYISISNPPSPHINPHSPQKTFIRIYKFATFVACLVIGAFFNDTRNDVFNDVWPIGYSNYANPSADQCFTTWYSEVARQS